MPEDVNIWFSKDTQMGQQVHGKTLNITSHQGNADQNHNGEHLTPVRTHPTEHTSAGEHAEKREPLCAQSVAV